MFSTDFISSMAKLCIASMMVVAFTMTISAEDLRPEISKGKGEACIDDKDFMRLNHMDLLRHDRDKTMRTGNRDIKYSLKKCINCHAVDGPDGKTLTVESPKHFCRSCHDYAAVSIDCFQCHASRPELKITDKNSSTLELPKTKKLTKGAEE